MEVRSKTTNKISTECICMETREKHVNISECHRRHSEGGHEITKYVPEEIPRDTICTCSEKTQTIPEKESSTVGCHQINKKKISNDRSDIYLTNIPNTELLETLDPELISKGKGLYPFWDPSLTDEYRKSWLPLKTECVASPLKLSNGCVNGQKQKSWFSTRSIKLRKRSLQRTSLRSYRYSVVDGTDEDVINTKKKKKVNDYVVRKIRVFPTTAQKSTMKKMAGTCRFLYNKTSQMIRDKEIPFSSIEEWKEMENKRRKEHDRKETEKRTEKGKKLKEQYYLQKELPIKNRTQFNKKWLETIKKFNSTPRVPYPEVTEPWENDIYMRDFMNPTTCDFFRKHPWLKETPYDTREAAIKEAIANHKACKTNKKRKNIKKFKSPFRKKKSKRWSFLVAHETLKYDTMFASKKFGKLRVSQPELLKPKYTIDFRLSKDDTRYYMILPDTYKQHEIAPDSQRSEVMSIDPGVIYRHCIYDTKGYVHFIGKNDISRIFRLCLSIDRKISMKASPSVNHLRRRRIGKQQSKTSFKIQNLKREIDNKTILFLVKSTRTILLPPFDVHSMVAKKTRNITSKTARSLMCWGHGAFKEKLKLRAKREGVKVLIVPEDYTSKTCGCCGSLCGIIGRDRVFQCRDCGFVCDRDVNGARNIYLRAIRRRTV